MKTRSRNLDVIHNGMVLVSDGRGKGRPARLELTRDILSVQVPVGMSDSLETSSDVDSGVRTVTIKRQKDGGLGLSVKAS
uniref:Uncharacterized protein n=1 Tax=Plectus sambesii TaxID=2011161 RepID=A0A914XN45_9BILA